MLLRPEIKNAKECFPINPSIKKKKKKSKNRKPEEVEEEHQSSEEESENEDVSQGISATGSLLNDPSRVGNTNWCQCNLCIPMPTALESICCYDVSKIFERIPEDAFCIIDNPDFENEVTNHERLDWGFRMSSFKITKQPRCGDYMR